MAVKLVNSDLENVYRIKESDSTLNSISIDDYRKLYDQFIALKPDTIIHNEEHFLTIFQILTIVSSYSEYDGYITVMNPSIIRKTLDNRFKWYLKNPSFEYVSLEFSILNYSFITDLFKDIEYDDITYGQTDSNNPLKLILNVGDTCGLTTDGDSKLSIYGCLIFNYKYNGQMKHVLIIFINYPSCYERFLLPHFINIDDEKYEKFKNEINNISESAQKDLNYFETEYIDYTEELF